MYEMGTEIYYTGDMANHEGTGTITSIKEATKYSPKFWVVTMEDKREFTLCSASFSKGPGRRFMLLKEYNEERAAKIAEMNVQYTKMGMTL